MTKSLSFHVSDLSPLSPLAPSAQMRLMDVPSLSLKDLLVNHLGSRMKRSSVDFLSRCPFYSTPIPAGDYMLRLPIVGSNGLDPNSAPFGILSLNEEIASLILIMLGIICLEKQGIQHAVPPTASLWCKETRKDRRIVFHPEDFSVGQATCESFPSDWYIAGATRL